MAKTASSSEQKIEAFAEDLGRILGTARAKADSWLGQRQAIVKQLTQLRDEASSSPEPARRASCRRRPTWSPSR